MSLALFAQDIKGAFEAVPKPEATPGRITTVISTILVALGILAVLMVAVGGLRYVASRGNPDQVAQAKNTIIYSIVGLVIALFALAIVRFVTGKLT